jgi:hypothetical protein
LNHDESSILNQLELTLLAMFTVGPEQSTPTICFRKRMSTLAAKWLVCRSVEGT